MEPTFGSLYMPAFLPSSMHITARPSSVFAWCAETRHISLPPTAPAVSPGGLVLLEEVAKIPSHRQPSGHALVRLPTKDRALHPLDRPACSASALSGRSAANLLGAERSWNH